MTAGISLKIPLRYDERDGPYQLTKTLPETIKQNFKNLIMTVPGERIMDPEFGVGIHNLLFEHENANLLEEFRERLYEQISRYLPFVKIINVETNFFDHKLNVVINYYISSLGVSDNLAVNVDRE